MKKLKDLKGVSGGFRGNYHADSIIEARNVILDDQSQKITEINKDYKSIRNINNKLNITNLF